MKVTKISDQSESPKTYQCRQLKLCLAVKFFFSSNGKNFTFHRKKVLGGLEACSGASETRGNEWAQDTRRHSFNGLKQTIENRKILMPFQLTQPAPSTRQITQRLLYF